MLAALALLLGGPAQASALDPTPDPLVAEVVAQVQTEAVYAYTGGLTGEWPVLISGQPYHITTRSSLAAESIQQATQYAYEQLQALGLQVSFHQWTSTWLSGRNVIGELPGLTRPDEIILLTAHLDDAPWSGIAPGADDNASGCVAVLLAAHILSQYRFERTLRFVFFTGEEQGLKGSQRYTAEIAALGEDVKAVLNMDMIAWDNLGGPIMRLYTRRSDHPDYLLDAVIASEFIQAIAAYGLGDTITPVLDSNGESRSDQASFWAVNYPAVLVSEDFDDDFNDFYHSRRDRLAALNLPYFTAIIQGALATAAHLAGVIGEAPGEYSARLEPPAAQRWADQGETATYTLSVTNTGVLADVYALTVTGNLWPVDGLPNALALAPGETAGFTIHVPVPGEVPGGTTDIATFALVSQAAGLPLDAATTFTVVDFERLYFPVVLR